MKTPIGCKCFPREATIDDELNIVCAECGALLADAAEACS